MFQEKFMKELNLKFFPKIEIVSINGIDAIKVDFSGNDIPYSAFGRYYIRIADEDRELAPNELRKMMISKEYEENWCDKLTSYTIADVKEECLLKFYENADRMWKIAKNWF